MRKVKLCLSRSATSQPWVNETEYADPDALARAIQSTELLCYYYSESGEKFNHMEDALSYLGVDPSKMVSFKRKHGFFIYNEDRQVGPIIGLVLSILSILGMGFFLIAPTLEFNIPIVTSIYSFMGFSALSIISGSLYNNRRLMTFGAISLILAFLKLMLVTG